MVHASEYNYSLCSLAMMTISLSAHRLVLWWNSFTNWRGHHSFSVQKYKKWWCPPFLSQAQKDVQLLTSSSKGWLAPSISSSLETIPSSEKAYIQVPNTGRRQNFHICRIIVSYSKVHTSCLFGLSSFPKLYIIKGNGKKEKGFWLELAPLHRSNLKLLFDLFAPQFCSVGSPN
ncbi:hypothetical protein OIU79_000860 [Salix purpurea]|uniref:Uncharacterized protein n=1 Tax=Salix purpurea TaxID=77065 RepID=A0A9Q0V366_SALPP|nr:hypothetical protein OIU79_000860 [Salix purpurea]